MDDKISQGNRGSFPTDLEAQVVVGHAVPIKDTTNFKLGEIFEHVQIICNITIELTTGDNTHDILQMNKKHIMQLPWIVEHGKNLPISQMIVCK